MEYQWNIGWYNPGMKLPGLSSLKIGKGTRVFLRVDWNVPLDGGLPAEDVFKIEKSLKTLKWLKEKGAVVIAATHLGRPKGREPSLSTKRLVAPLSRDFGLEVGFLPFDLSDVSEAKQARNIVALAAPGAVFLLENVRFFPGEEENAASLAAGYAQLAEYFVNEAFASSHRAHASVVGIAKKLPSAAGFLFEEEVEALTRVVEKPKGPFVAIVGGAKVSTKVDVIKALLKTADAVCIGGAMANTFFLAQGKKMGKSLVEPEAVATAKSLLRAKNLVLPEDVLVADALEPGHRPRTVATDAVKAADVVGDVGPTTMRAWSALVRKAKTIVWNGPLGRAEVAAFSHGSRVLGQAIAARSRGKAFGVVGGGDTVPVLLSTKMHEGVDHISTGGGAMLEFLVEEGELPGILALVPGAAAKSAPKKKPSAKPKTKTAVRAKPAIRSKTRKR